MSTPKILAGAVDNGNPMQADFAFFSGPVRIRLYGDQVKFAFSGKPLAPRCSMAGMLDDIAATAVDVKYTTKDGAEESRPRRAVTYAVTVTLALAAEGEPA